MDPCLLTLELAERQHEWLRGARSRLLRLADIARCQDVLEVGAGFGFAADETSRRFNGSMAAVDRCEAQVEFIRRNFDSVEAYCADVLALPFADNSFDLVFGQFAFLWFDMSKALDEALRVLRDDGALALIEPDYEALIEYPLDLGLREAWVTAIRAAGGCAHAGRWLTAELRARGMHVRTLLADQLTENSAEALEFLAALGEHLPAGRIESMKARLHEPTIVHLPLFLVCATYE